MKIAKETRKVNIICQDGSFVKGFVHISPGERTLDFINHPKNNFIAVTKVEFYREEIPQSFKLASAPIIKRDVIILNKSAIKWIEEA